MSAPYRWPTASRLPKALFHAPEPVLRRLAGAEPLQRDGRTLDPGVQALLGVLARLDGRAAEQNIPARRRHAQRLAAMAMPQRRDVTCAELQIPGPVGGARMAARIYRPRGGLPARPPALLYLHGGGWVIGDLQTHDNSCRVLAALARCVVVSLDYRLAPEHPFPAALEDSVAAFGWLTSHARTLGVDPDRIGIAGDSAGANLATVAARRLRDAGERTPSVQILIYPPTDMTMSTPSHRSMAKGFLLDEDTMHWYRKHYVPDGYDIRHPDLSPLFADDLSGLPPALVLTAGFDPLRDEGQAYAEALRRAGVRVEYDCYDALVHSFFVMGLTRGALEAVEDVARRAGDLLRA